MEDILKVSIFEKTYKNICIFKNVNSLINGSRYIMGIKPDDIGLRMYGVNEINSWIIISSLNLLFSIKDVIKKDLNEHHLLREWEKSKWKKKIEKEDVLLRVLREVRNHNIHIQVWKNQIKNYQGMIGNDKVSNLKIVHMGEQVFFKCIDFSNMKELRNVKKGTINLEDIEWFNKQSSMYPAFALICEARERYAKYISSFISENIKAEQ